MPAPRVIALDLDGTLVCHTTTLLPAAHERLVRMLTKRGIQVVLVTGRSHMTTVPLWQRLELDTPIICFNGSWVGFADQRCITQHCLPAAAVREIIDVLKPHPGSINLYPDINRWIMNKPCPTTAGWATLYKTDIQVRPELFEDWQHDSLKVLYGCDISIIDATIRELRQRFGQRFAFVKSQPDRFEILPHVNKATGLAELARHLELQPEQIWAVGDAENDLEMMRWPGRTFAMGHAPAIVRQAADHVLPGIDARGLAALPPYIERAADESATADR